MVERDLLHFANGSQKACSPIDSSGLQGSLQRFEDGVLIFSNFSLKNIKICNELLSKFATRLPRRTGFFLFLNKEFFELDNYAKDQGEYVDVYECRITEHGINWSLDNVLNGPI